MVRILSFISLIVMLLVLALATGMEKAWGTDWVSDYVYRSPWFVVLWGVIAASGMMWLVHSKVHRLKPVFGLHLAFCVILLGALCSYLWGDSGYVHLRKGVPATCYVSQENDEIHSFPFLLVLQEFDIENYPGTMSPSDYVSLVSVRQDDRAQMARISMNQILKVAGYRFYQSSYDEDGQGSVLLVSHDPLGITVTYIGYALLVLAMGWVLVDKNGTFRRLLRHPMLKAVVVAVCLFGAGDVQAATFDGASAEQLGRTRVHYQGRVTLMQTFAVDFTKKLTGGKAFRDYTAEQVLSGWLFDAERWQSEPMIRVKDNQLQQVLGVGAFAAWNDFFTADGQYRLAAMHRQLMESHADDKLLRALVEVDEKVQLAAMLQSGALLQVVPVCQDDAVAWLTLADSLPAEWQAMVQGDSLAIARWTAAQENALGALLPSTLETECEYFLNNFNVINGLYRFNLALGVMAIAYFVWGLLTGRRKRWISVLFYIQLIHAFAFLSVAMALRWYVSGHIPLSNGYETMLFIAWCVLLLTFVMGKRVEIVPAAGLLLSGFALLVASLGDMNPQITQLMPVLQSPWLSLHVSLIMVSYALLAFMALNGLTALTMTLFARKSQYDNVLEQSERLALFSRMMLFPATFLLAVGIFVGAVWANVSWGNYWSWDPKETWALITMLVYSLAFHRNSIPMMGNPFVVQLFFVGAFLTVLMTYFGVNLFLGGMHSYGGMENGSLSAWGYLLCALSALAVLMLLGIRKNRRMLSTIE